MAPRRTNPAIKLFHAIVLFGAALTGGACGGEDDSGDGQGAGGSGGTGGTNSDGGAGEAGSSGTGGGDASPWW